jgi:EAL domain-containing protein (putative c-di-GMP-specific phosphodiesterase class I)
MRREGRAYVEAAIRARAFDLVYQPIVHLDSARISGVEALCRFHDGRPADLWFRQVEALGLAAEMDVVVVERATEDLPLLPPGSLFLNLSATTLARPEPLLTALLPILDERVVVVELTEHMMVADYQAVIESLRILRTAGVLLAVDDAGAGYSTFQHILRLRPDVIKLDRSITSGVDCDAAKRALTNALVIFAAETSASVIAEGIETEGELMTLRESGVTRGQGYWLARPQRAPLPPISYAPVGYAEMLDDPRLGGVGDFGPRRAVRIDPDPAAAVMAHGVMNSLACVTTAVDMLRSGDGTLSTEELRALTSVLHRQVKSISDTVKHLVRGLPREAIEALDQLAISDTGT